MTNYEFLLEFSKQALYDLCEKNFLRSTVLRDIEIYEYYIQQCQKECKMQARTNTSTHFDLSEETVSKIIQRMRS